jgi:hypothetical protein
MVCASSGLLSFPPAPEISDDLELSAIFLAFFPLALFILIEK